MNHSDHMYVSALSVCDRSGVSRNSPGTEVAASVEPSRESAADKGDVPPCLMSRSTLFSYGGSKKMIESLLTTSSLMILVALCVTLPSSSDHYPVMRFTGAASAFVGVWCIAIAMGFALTSVITGI